MIDFEKFSLVTPKDHKSAKILKLLTLKNANLM